MAIKPGGCGRLDELIDRSAEEEEEEEGAAGGILMQDRCQRGILHQLRTSPAAQSPLDFRALGASWIKVKQ